MGQPFVFMIHPGGVASRKKLRRPGNSPTLSPAHGEMAEWFKAHAWKACVGLYPTGSSNLPLSATTTKDRQMPTKSLLLLTLTLIAGIIRVAAAEADDSGFTSLFDGKTL